MWVDQLNNEDVNVIEISDEIEILPKDTDLDSKPFLSDELCKDMLNKLNENVNYLHLQTINSNKLNGTNIPEVDLEYKVTNGSLKNEKNGKFSIENVEIKKQIIQENEDEIQNSVIKIQNNHLKLIDADKKQQQQHSNDNEQNTVDSDSNSLLYYMNLNQNLRNNQLTNQFNDQSNNHSNSNIRTMNSPVGSIDIHPKFKSKLSFSSNEEYERDLKKKYLANSALENVLKPDVKIDLKKRFDNELTYPICSRPRGYCMIINNVNFKIYEERRGSDLEAAHLSEIFKQLGFEIIYYRNSTATAMLEHFKNIAKCEELSRHDTFISIILTHGDDGRVLIGTDAQRLKIDSFLHYFGNAYCPQLANKPKLFFIQACRGRNHDFGTYDTANVCDAIPVKTSCSKVREELKEPNRLNDTLIVNSTLDGFVSLRNEILGSWFGETLGYALCEYSKDLELQSLLTLVNRRILEREKGDVQQAIECNYIRFRKKFYFNPGHYFTKKHDH